MKRKIGRNLTILAIGFTVLFLLRFLYGFYLTSQPTEVQYNVQQRSNFEFSINNYASSKMKIKGSSAVQSIDQKYQKIASIDTESVRFEKDEKQLRMAVKNFKALIQYEQNSGLKGGRVLNLAIGVLPDRFDKMVAVLKKIGRLQSINIDKIDKTNEFKDLQGQRSSLEKTRNALLALKARGGKIDEFINLENRILEIEEKIQKMGVQLGEYDATNEFCTVKLTLTEVGLPQQISMVQRLFVAFCWTVKYYAVMIAILFFGSLTLLIGAIVLEKLKKLFGASAKAIDQ